ncbi:hypothetical protein J5Y04_20255 [Kitasatospora sp. RG8]|uniref:hypothetical protein n=1 Tax=Kitasatospora sp. RG8 TaxID=2820815 RepID=UPI001ADFA490|nr:hypothetical protein [Kitasatospora sp. RG8]MBP0451857.1 hypothetical protein [Kitasatospora sp. RG8]
MARTTRRAGSAAGRTAQRTAAGVLPGVGVLGLLLFSLGREHAWQALGGGLVVAGASVVLGGALGFLFGVPRVRGGAGPNGEPHGSYAPNTNLEQVSDWLTKVLLGVGLTQLGSLGERLHRLGTALAPALGGDEGAVPFAVALVLYFLVSGFLAGWLVTRLTLPQVLSDADQALDLFLAGQDRDRKGDKVGADDFRVRAMQHLGLLGNSAERPEQLAGQLPPSAVAGPEGVVAEVRSTARRSALTAQQVRELFADGSEGRRIQALALMQGDPSLADLSSLLDAIEQPRSGFEQYHALLAARGLLSRLPAAEAQRLREAVAGRLMAPDGIPYGSDRSWLAEKILSRLEAPAVPAPEAPTQVAPVPDAPVPVAPAPVVLPQQAGPAGEAQPQPPA